MSQKHEELMTPEFVDQVLQDVKKSISGDEKITLKKAIVDKRAMGGDTTKEVDYSSGGGRLYKDGKSAGSHPADGGYRGNFATDYPMDKPAAEGSALSGAIKESAVAKEKKKPLGLTKGFDKGSMGSKSSPKGSSSTSSPKMKKAIGEKIVADGSGSEPSADEAPKKNSTNKNSKDKAMFKGLDSESKVSPDGMSGKSATPKEKNADSSKSAASRLSVKKSVGKYMAKSIDLIASAQRHIKKAYEDGSGKDLDIAGERLVDANKNIAKAVRNGEEVPEHVSNRLEKAAKYFAKAIREYEADNVEGHIDAVEKTNHNLSKALANFGSFKKSLNAEPIEKVVEKAVEEKPLAKSVDIEVKFTQEGDKFVMAAMDEATFKEVRKALNEKGLYKSLNDELTEEKKTIDASPLLKGLVDKLGSKHDSLRDAILESKESDKEFKQAVLKSLEAFALLAKSNTKEIEDLKATPKERKSLTKAIPSVYEGEDNVGGHEGTAPRSKENGDLLFKGVPVGELLMRGLEKAVSPDEKNRLTKAALAWDVDKNYTEEIPADILSFCKSVLRN